MRKLTDDGIYQLVTPFPEFTQVEALNYRDDLEANPRVIKKLPYILPYLVQNGGDTLLIDCGWNTDGAYEGLHGEFKSAGIGLDEVQTLLITHGHPDHAGMAGRLNQEYGSKILIHELELEDGELGSMKIDTKEMGVWLSKHGVATAEAEQLLGSEMPMRKMVADLKADQTLKGGEEIRVGDFLFEVIWTPGHTPGHICLYERNRKILLTGDHVLPTITPNVSLGRSGDANPLQTYVKSLKLVEALDVEHMLPAHEWDIRWFKKRIAEIRGHHEARLNEMKTAVGTNSATAHDVARRMVWTIGHYDEFPPIMQMAAMGETLAHLEYLVEENVLRSHEDSGVVHFSLV